MRRHIKKHIRDFLAILGLVVMATFVGGFILANQRVTLPGWVPVVGQDFYTLKAEFRTGQAVVPGQGEAVKVAGVKIGDITAVELNNGQAVVSMKIKREYAPIYKNATMLLSPTTLLKDENIALDPGTPDAGAIADGGTLPQSNTEPDVNLDEILASLDTDTREYLKILISSGSQGLEDNSSNFNATLKQLSLTTSYLERINSQLALRRRNLARLIHNFQLLVGATGTKDRQLTQLVDSLNANFQALANQDKALREAVRLLPGTLTTTKDALADTDETAKLLRPTLTKLRPGARALAKTSKDLRSLFKDTESIVRDDLRPFSRDVRTPVKNLRSASAGLAEIAPNLTTAVGVVNYLLNELAFDPDGSEQPFLFWAAWSSHNLASALATQDATGPKLRGLLGFRCSDLTIINTLAKDPKLSYVRLLQLSLGAPDLNKVC